MKIEIHIRTSDGNVSGQATYGDVGGIAEMINSLRGKQFSEVEIAAINLRCQQDCQRLFDVLRYVSERFVKQESMKQLGGGTIIEIDEPKKSGPRWLNQNNEHD